MNRLAKLRQQRQALAAQANAALDAVLAKAVAEGRDLTDEEKAAQAEFDGKLKVLDSQIEFEQRRLDREQATAAAAAVANPVLDAGPVAPGTTQVEVGPPNVARDPMRGFRNTGDFAVAVMRASRPMGAVDQRLIDGGLVSGGSLQAAPTNYHQESGTPEGAMVPPAIREQIWQLVFTDPLLALLTIEPTERNVVEMLADETTPWGASGIVAKWRSEGVQMTPSKLDTKNRQVRLNELYAFVLATDELLEDAPRLNDRLNVKAPQAIRWKLVEAFMTGTGAGQPLGWASANYAGKILVNRANATKIDATDVSKLFSRLLVTDGPDRSFFITNRDTLPQLVTMTIGQQPVWQPPNGMMGAPGGTLLGRGLFFSEHAETLGTAGDLQLVNPDGYYATQRGQGRQDSSIHLYFDYAITAFRWRFRFGGQPMLSAAVAAAKGANTKSHFVVLN